MKESHKQKIISAALAAVIDIAVILFYPLFLSWIDDLPRAVTIPFSLFYFAAAGGVLYQFYERVKEILRGEEDDLDNY